MAVLALLFVLPPLWRQSPVAADDADQHNLAIARQRLAELNGQLQAGVLAQADYDSQRGELELALSDDLAAAKPPSAKPAGRWLVFGLVLAIPLLSAGLYTRLGNFQAIEPTPEMLGGQAGAPSLADIENMVGKLAARMQANPDDAEGWLMLGKSYKHLQQFPKAAEAFKNAYRLLGDQPEIMLLYAGALAYANDGQLVGEPALLVEKVVALQPDNTSALFLAGMAKAQAGDTAAAARLWRKLSGLLQPESPEQQEVQRLLAQVETSPNTARPSTGTQTGQAASISVQVSLAPEFKHKAQPDDIVFIYAQALSGPKMPLAIVRKTVADLPLTVTLSDAQSVMPNMKLSDFSEVKLLARITQSGDAVAQAGDLFGSIESIAVGDNARPTLLINGVIK